MSGIIRKIKRIWYVYIKKDTTKFARMLGVRVGEHGQILTDPVKAFGTEPWLVTLGDHVDVTADVQFLTHEGGIWVARGLKKELNEYDKFAPIKVGNNVMIGIRSIIMPGVTIGDNVIIAANSIVTKDVPSNSIIGGMPAKKISDLDKFMSRIEENTVLTKRMTQEEKRVYLMEKFPEWFA